MNKKVDATALMSQVAENLIFQLASLSAPPDKLVVAFSGGVDSAFLLHSLFVSRTAGHIQPAIHAVYINHGLSVNATHWQQHCATFCNYRGITFEAITVEVEKLPRTSLEASARDARYRALLHYCQQHHGALVLGQHQDDQAETLLLALKRGSGAAGLAGMQAHSTRDGIDLFRPLLGVQRAHINRAAKTLGLDWVDDESNDDNRFDRNFLRNAVLPVLHQRWPQFSASVGRSCELLQEQNSLLAEATDERFLALLNADGTLSVTGLLALSPAWRRTVIRHWLSVNHKDMLSRAQLQEVLFMLMAREDASPEVSAADYVIRRYSCRLYLTGKGLSLPVVTPLETGKAQCLTWWPLSFSVTGAGAWHAVPAVSFEKLTVRNNPRGKSPRKWFKEWKVPPWVRENVPVLTLRGSPVALLLTDRVIFLAQFDADTTEVHCELNN